jgi:hypothetical protein
MRGLGEPCALDTECIPWPADAHCADGRCVSTTYPHPIPLPPSDEETALAAAEQLSALEATGQYGALYDAMHPDAQAVIPRAAVIGWYESVFAPRGPQVAHAVKVRFLAWAWAVTGKGYLRTADVAFRQAFADGTVLEDEVRLVKNEQGDWSWFFGRDRAFVDEQIALYAGGE